MGNAIRCGILLLALIGNVLAQRPHTPFVERVVTPERSRQLKVALNQKLWILYDLPQCQLYQAWSGGTAGGTLITADYTFFDQAAHFPHWFNAEGTQYFKEDVGEYFASWTKPADIDTYYTKWPIQPRNYKAWVVFSGSQTTASETRFKGYSVNGDAFKLNFTLMLTDGGEITISEVPEYAASGTKTSLVRKLTFTGIPAGYSARLNLPVGGNWVVTGSGSKQGSVLVQTSDGESTLTGSW